MRAVRRPLLLALGLAFLVPSPRVGAEDAPPPRRPTPRDGGGFKFSPPDETPPTTEPADKPPKAGTPAAPTPSTAEGPAEAAIRRLATWPGQDGIKAAETLLLMGPDAVDPVLRAVARGDPSVRPGAAWVLGKIGSPSHVPAILTAAAESSNGSRIEVFFQAAYELDAAITKRWLFSFLTLERPVFRARATEFLAGIVSPEDRPKIDGLLRAPSRQAGVRIAGLELLARTGMADATPRVVEALSDPHPDVARRAAQILAASDDAAVVAQLNSLVRDGDARQRGYATLALVEHTRRARANGFEPATIPTLIGRKGLLHPDKLLRATSAIGLAYGALDDPDPAVGDLLDRDVVSVLIETAGGDHFLDYGSVIESVFAALRRLSGLDLPSTAKPWAQWWQEHLGNFHARRTLSSVTDADLPRTRVTFEVTDSDGRRRRAAFVPEGAEPADGAFVLPHPAFQALLGGLEDAGLFSQPDDARTLSDEHMVVRVGVMNQEKRMVLVPSGEDPRYATLMARLGALEETNLWQRYRDTDEFPDAAAWWARESEAFGAAAPEVRRSMLLHMVVASFDDLKTDADRAVGLDLIERFGAENLPDADAQTLLAWAAQSPSFGAVESRTVDTVAALGRPTLAEPLVEALARSSAPAAAQRLADTLAAEGPIRVREGFADPRPPVRSAAALAASQLLAGPTGRDATARERLGTLLTEGLKALLLDPDPVVRVRAASSLAMLGDATMLEKLEGFYREGTTPTRIAIAQALGIVGGPPVQPMLVRIVGEVGPDAAPVRAAALQAMAASNNPEATRVLAFYMLNDADAGVMDAAERALISVRTDDARLALVDLLSAGSLDGPKRARVVRALSAFESPAVRETLGRYLEDTDPQVVDQAALGLAAQREGVAVPYLVALLRRPEEPLRPRALEALQDLTSVTLLVTSYDATAEQYEAWYRTHRQGNDRAWFRDAVAKKGYDASSLAGYVRGDADVAAVPLLLRTIRDEDPVLRRNSDLALRRVTGHEPAVRVDRSVSRQEALAAADAWSTWWSRRQAAGDGRR